jgi:hypothetical protein
MSQCGSGPRPRSPLCPRARPQGADESEMKGWRLPRGTRRVQLVRRDGRDVSTLYGREGEGGGGCEVVLSASPPEVSEDGQERAGPPRELHSRIAGPQPRPRLPAGPRTALVPPAPHSVKPLSVELLKASTSPPAPLPYYCPYRCPYCTLSLLKASPFSLPLPHTVEPLRGGSRDPRTPPSLPLSLPRTPPHRSPYASPHRTRPPPPYRCAPPL